ncbi:glycerophosphodiester phosphodiesterase family protein [Pedobacter sp. WC2501]|uniref:glycerophosphodiester phosphodiesterase family protein n=1 Tax=Pedobacter sp. WC2501 TaxID=3461400 RepID=UPI0040453BCB
MINRNQNTKRLRFLVCAIACLQLFASATKAQNKIIVTAHRGDWRNEPENSMPAFLSAIKMGVDIVELDLGKSKDGALIIMHDQTIDRSTTGKGKPSDYTLRELKTFRLRNGCGIPTDNTIPTFKEVMAALKGKKVMVNLDKSFAYYREAYQVLTETGTLSQALFKSDEPYDILKNRYPELIAKIKYMPVINLDKPDARLNIINYLKAMKPYAFELIFSRDTSAILYHNEFIRNTGARVWINSLWASLNGGHYDDMAVEQNNKKDSWDWIVARNATIIQTDRPQLLLEYLRSKKLHQ